MQGKSGCLKLGGIGCGGLVGVVILLAAAGFILQSMKSPEQKAAEEQQRSDQAAKRAADEAAQDLARQQNAAEAKASQDAKVASLAEFSAIKDGMTYSQVVSIIGSEGEEISSSSIGEYRTVMYKWNGSGSFGANMNAMFQNGRLISKAQFGLK